MGFNWDLQKHYWQKRQENLKFRKAQGKWYRDVRWSGHVHAESWASCSLIKVWENFRLCPVEDIGHFIQNIKKQD